MAELEIRNHLKEYVRITVADGYHGSTAKIRVGGRSEVVDGAKVVYSEEIWLSEVELLHLQTIVNEAVETMRFQRSKRRI